ncbi:helix-turn-helix domain-containing protein [Dactylosporangium sp. NPDC051541]|uniref:AraC family transcriptional regulator n=1 Tax=Dactylosporangium sp. NPDC051541 TaxID=3363977 RepID=UPI00379BEC97
MESYVESAPRPELAGVVRTVWVQRTGPTAYPQRHLPTGGVELHAPLGGRPWLLGPLTRPRTESIPAGTTVVGVRFWPGAAPPLPAAAEDLVDQRVSVPDTWSRGETDPGRVLALLQAGLLREFRRAGRPDPLVRTAVLALMPWRPVSVGPLAAALGLSVSQLRRRCLHTVGLSPKVLQRTLRLQGFLALAQAGAAPSAAGLAADLGYADQAHLNRECVRLTGLTPKELLGTAERCVCGHDHAASYGPLLAMRDSFKTAPPSRLVGWWA